MSEFETFLKKAGIFTATFAPASSWGRGFRWRRCETWGSSPA